MAINEAYEERVVQPTVVDIAVTYFFFSSDTLEINDNASSTVNKRFLCKKQDSCLVKFSCEKMREIGSLN